jgi:type I restriction enzyme M protein
MVASRDEIAAQNFVLTPNRYVGTPEADEDEMPAHERLEQIRRRLLVELDDSAVVEKRLRELLNLVIINE